MPKVGTRWKAFWVASAVALASIAAIGYWYVFVAGAPQLDPPKPTPKTGLTFQLQSFRSKAMGEVRSYGLVLPPQYAQQPQQHYPVIVLLHGGHGDARDYQIKAALTSVLHELYRTRKLPPSIVVTPDGNDHRGSSPFWDPQYFNGPHGQVDTLIGTELVKVLKLRYRTLNQPAFWAIGGLSSGGWGAFNIGFRHLEQFNILFSHTGYFTDQSGHANSPLLNIANIPLENRRKLKVYLDAGSADPEYMNASRQFDRALQKAGIASEFHIFPGGHGIFGQNVGWNYWHKHLADSLSFVGRQFQVALKREPSTNPAHIDKSR